MTTEREPIGLQLHIEDGPLTLDFFDRTAHDLRLLLRMIESGQSGQPAHAEWVMPITTIRITGSANGVPAESLQEIIADTYEGFKAVGQEEGDWPPSVASEAQLLIRRIIARVQRTAKGRMEVGGLEAGKPAAIHFERKPRSGTVQPKEWYSAWSSVEGQLDIVSVRQAPYFVIFEHLTGHRVRCTFTDAFLQQVKDGLGQRVMAEGLVRYRRDGAPLRLTNPTSLELVPDPVEEDITRYKGSLPGFTGELSSYEYVRRMREGENG